MPKGIYKRKPGMKRTISDDTKERFREILAQNRESPRFKESSARNAGKAAGVRTARAIIKRCPIGAKPGYSFPIPGGPRSFEVIDPAPVKTTHADGSSFWKQRFTMITRIKTGKVKREVRSSIVITWDYEPTVENILRMPIAEEIK